MCCLRQFGDFKNALGDVVLGGHLLVLQKHVLVTHMLLPLGANQNVLTKRAVGTVRLYHGCV